MRIVSQLVPSGQPISTDIEGARQPGSKTWEIPSWGRPLALGVYPLFVSRERSLVPVGTAFCISKLGVSMTALHNLREAVHDRWRGETLGQADTLQTRKTRRRIGMAVFHHRVLSRGRFSGKIWVFEAIEEVQPADVCYIFPQFHGQFPYLPLPISFAAPRIGSRVVCVGFSDHSADGGLSLDDVQSGRLNLLDIFEHKLRAVEARVTRIFRRRFTRGFIGGPCYSIDAELDHNMNGGPVFSESGYVCGILSGRATGFLGEPASIISLLYPALTVKVRFDGQMGAMRISSDLRLIDLIAQSSVTSDGSEHLLTKPGGTGEFSLWPAFPEEDADGLYNDFSDLEKQCDADR